MKLTALLFSALLLVVSHTAVAEDVNPLQYDDVFLLEFASDPQPHPADDRLVFVRNWMDRTADRNRASIWEMNADGSGLQPLFDHDLNAGSPRWSPSGDRIAFTAGGQIHMHWVDSGRTSKISALQQSPSSISWSPDGEWLAFVMFKPKQTSAPVNLPGRPSGADWADAPIYIDSMNYRADGRGYLSQGYRHIYIMPAEGGTPIQLTDGDYNHGGNLAWANDGSSIYFSANRVEKPEKEPSNSNLYRIDIADRTVTQITDRFGPDANPKISPNGQMIAYTGFDDRKLAQQNHRLYVVDLDGKIVTNLTEDLDQHIRDFEWSSDSRSLVIYYDDKGHGTLARQPLHGDRQVLTTGVGGLSYSRPYSGGQFALMADDTPVFTQSSTQHPAELAVLRDGEAHTLTRLNRDLLAKRTIGDVEEFWYESSVDGRDIHGWIIYPPGFDPDKKYPLILEIHGGPHTAYGPYFAMELQLMAAQGYVVLYTNPRGSTSYGEDFANLIHHNYPSHDHDDLMDGVDAVIDRGFVNEDELFIIGGSGGGVLTTWAIGHTDRFRAAVAVNPVINWYSFVLNADMYNYFSQYWFPALPWEDPDHYLKYSPISYVGNVSTPTMLFTGEADHRTPISETEQYYQALQLRGVDTAMVRIPDASHALHARPSNHMAKPAYAIYWFEKYRNKD